jgi:hypothetical protein
VPDGQQVVIPDVGQSIVDFMVYGVLEPETAGAGGAVRPGRAVTHAF